MHDNSSRHLVRVDYGFFRAERLTNRSSIIEQGLVLIINYTRTVSRSTPTWAYEETFFPSAQKIFPFSNPNPFPFVPKETKIREDNFSEMKEREESSSIFVVGEKDI